VLYLLPKWSVTLTGTQAGVYAKVRHETRPRLTLWHRLLKYSEEPSHRAIPCCGKALRHHITSNIPPALHRRHTLSLQKRLLIIKRPKSPQVAAEELVLTITPKLLINIPSWTVLSSATNLFSCPTTPSFYSLLYESQMC